METHWERRETYIPLTLEGARLLLAPSRIEVRALSLIEEGKQATNYLLETPEGRRVLRLPGRSIEKRELSNLAPKCVPIPKIIEIDEAYVLSEWVPGVTLEKALVTGRALDYEMIARQLATSRLAMNEVRCAFAGFFDPDEFKLYFDFTGLHEDPLAIKDPWPTAVEGLLGWLGHLLPSLALLEQTKGRIAKVVDDAEPRLQGIAGPPVLVHGDFKPSNILVDESGLTAVLDWEFAHAGTWLSDVGQLLRHPESLPLGFADAFLDEIKAPEDTMLLARTLDLVNLIDFLYKESEQPTMRRDVERRIGEVCGLYEARFGLLP